MSDQPSDYRQSLLFRHCKTEERYRAALAATALHKRQDQEACRRFVNTHSMPVNEGPPAALRTAPPVEPRDRLNTFVMYLEAAIREYPDKMRELLAPICLDILEEFNRGEESQ